MQHARDDIDIVMSTIFNFPSLAATTVLQSIHTVGQRISVMMAAKKADINDLPDEMIREILLFVMEPPSEPQKPDTDLHLHSPVFSPSYPVTSFPLTQVCRRWRVIACKAKPLWGSIAIFHPHTKQIPRAALWLKYGDGHNLDIVLHQSDRLDREENLATQKILALLVERVEKWANVDFRFSQYFLPPVLVGHMYRIRNHPSPILRKAIITHRSHGMLAPETPGGVWSSLQEMPAIQHVEWLSSAPVTAPSSANLHTLVSHGFSFKVFVETLGLCPNLREVDVKLLDIPPEENDDNQVRVEHTHLRRLAIKGHQKDIKTFLYLFTFPALVSLELDTIDASACMYLWKLLRQSRCTLTRLILQVENAQGLDVAGWFEQHVLENLETLVIAGAEINDHVLLMLTCPPLRGNRPAYFEKLKYLSLANVSPNVDDDVLLRMLGSRFWTPQDAAKKTELVTAAVGVLDKTKKMAMYEKMINACAKGMADSKDLDWRHWKDRSLQIKQV